MASIVYPMLLFIFIIGAGMTFMNNIDGQGTGMYEVRMPSSGISSNTSQATQLTEGMSDSSKTANLNYIEMLWLGGQVIAGGLTALLTLGPLMETFHVPHSLMLWFISPLGIVLVYWVIEFWLGRPAE